MINSLLVRCLAMAACSSLASFPSYASSQAGGVITFRGQVLEPTRAAMHVGPGLQAKVVPGVHSAVYTAPLDEANTALSSQLLDYFGGYADESAQLITTIHL